MSAQKSGDVTSNRFARTLERNAEVGHRIPIARSGGGV